MIPRLAIIGVGLIGGSFALDLKAQGRVERVIGAGRSRASLEKALALGLIDEIATTPAEAARQADVLLLAVPVGAMPAVLRELAPHLLPASIVTDAGSTKQDVIAAARVALGDKIGQFVPAHPIAGAETSGPEAARTGLYQDKALILTPLPENRPEDVEIVANLWAACGARVARMDAARHDQVFAAVSHLPHLAAFALVDDLAHRPTAEACFKYAGAGFRDFTRIAASSPEMWRDIALANRDALVGELDAYVAKLEEMRALVAGGDADALLALFTRASHERRNWKGG